MRGRTARAAILAAAALLPSCQTVKDPFPAQSAFSFDLIDSNIAGQRSISPKPQIVSWTVEAAYATDIDGYDGTFAFLPNPPCLYTENVLALVSFSSLCGASGLTLPAGPTRKANIHVSFSRIELRQAERPDLSNSADPDGDGIPNSADNCPIIYNPDQADVDAATESFPVGDACSDLDSSNSPTIPDQDKDGVPDLTDNCLWYFSPATGDVNVPPDSNVNGIGDACERVAGIILPPRGLSVTCKVTFTSTVSQASRFVMDFGRAGILNCVSPTNCSIDPTALVLVLVGSTTTFPCTVDP